MGAPRAESRREYHPGVAARQQPLGRRPRKDAGRFQAQWPRDEPAAPGHASDGARRTGHGSRTTPVLGGRARPFRSRRFGAVPSTGRRGDPCRLRDRRRYRGRRRFGATLRRTSRRRRGAVRARTHAGAGLEAGVIQDAVRSTTASRFGWPRVGPVIRENPIHRRTVAGSTMTRASFQRGQFRRSEIRNSRSPRRSFGRGTCRR